MVDDALQLSLHMSEDGLPSVTLGGREIDSLDQLNRLGLDLDDPAALGAYCEAANHLARGYQYTFITDPDAYRADYEARFAAEDPDAEWQQGLPRLHDFGRCDTASIAAPRADAKGVVVFVDHQFLRIPYCATFPRSAATPEDAQYVPLPMASVAADE